MNKDCPSAPVERTVRPSWTVGYNWQPIGRETKPEETYPINSWVGTGFLFFDEKHVAKEWYEKLIGIGMVPFMRPYHDNDWEHVGAAHKMTPNA